MKSPSSTLLGSLRDYLLALPTRWTYNLIYPLMTCATYISQIRSDLWVEEPFKALPLFAP